MPTIFRVLIMLLLLTITVGIFGCGDDDDDDSGSSADDDDDDDDDAIDDDDDNTSYTYEVPLDPLSPWPKFRRTARQTGQCPVTPEPTGAEAWTFQTGKGIFSTPVIDGDGVIYIGSADQKFYAINPDGTEKWSFLTGEIIDSSALLDDKGRVYFGSGDGHFYALDREDGTLIWDFEADDPSVNDAFINWFEGNVAMRSDGVLIVPNDNFCTYALDRDTGEKLWCFETSDQTWSLPAYDAQKDTLYIGNNYLLWENVFSVNAQTGQANWADVNIGTSMVASPAIWGAGEQAAILIGGFDGLLRSYHADSGEVLWTTGFRDHIYSSPTISDNGEIIQASADGTIYSLDSAGSILWAFDTLEPIRSSPAIDADGNIYVGSGEGRLYVLNPEGTLRYSIKLIDDDRNDLNASVALGKKGAVIAGESGGVFFVPFDYCLHEDTADDPRCIPGPDESLPKEGALLYYATPFGALLADPPETIQSNQPLTFFLFVREDNDTIQALIDSETVEVNFTPDVDATVDVSGDRRFITLIPNGNLLGTSGGTLTVQVTGDYKINFQRTGLRFYGGEYGGTFDQTFTFDIPAAEGPTAMPWPVPAAPGDDSGIVEIYRLAAPLPTILPSYNQIGFDSIHYLAGMVEGDGNRAIAWGIGAKLDTQGQDTIVDPESRVRFPMVFEFDKGLLTIIDEEGFTIEFNGFPLPFEFFRIATSVDDDGASVSRPAINARAVCSDIDFYGIFMKLLGYCNPDTDLLNVFGGSEFRVHGTGIQQAPTGLGTVDFNKSGLELSAQISGSTIKAAEHYIGLFIVDATGDTPVRANYVENTTVETDGNGNITTVTLDADDLPGSFRLYLMIDAYAAAMQTF